MCNQESAARNRTLTRTLTCQPISCPDCSLSHLPRAHNRNSRVIPKLCTRRNCHAIRQKQEEEPIKSRQSVCESCDVSINSSGVDRENLRTNPGADLGLSCKKHARKYSVIFFLSFFFLSFYFYEKNKG